jgi:putative transcriptional regulator
MTTKTNARLTKELLAMASDMNASGMMEDAAYKKITMRHLGRAALSTAKSGSKRRGCRQIKMSDN